MKARDFVYWLQGYLELQRADGVTSGLSANQTACIARHLNLVFEHDIDPSHGTPELVETLRRLHAEGTTAPGVEMTAQDLQGAIKRLDAVEEKAERAEKTAQDAIRSGRRGPERMMC